MDSGKPQSRRLASSNKHGDYSKTSKQIDENMIL